MLVEDLLVLPNSTANTVFFSGVTDAFDTAQLLDTNRRLAEFAKLRFFQGAANYIGVDVYIVDAGEDYRDFFPRLANFGFRADSGYLELGPGGYEIVVTQRGLPDTVLAGPLAVDLAAAGIYGILITDTADVEVASLVLYDDFTP
jgi:hypothetical protein